MSGSVVLVDNNNRPILPVRDRAPEWGQMLAGAQQYAFSNQFVAFVPGVVVAAAVFAFNLLGEGTRAATDPFSSLSLSPRAVGALGRGLLGLALLGGLFFGVAEARSTEVSFDDALRLAREAVERVEPGDELLAAVVRYRSDAHALAKPQKFNFYFRSHGIFEIVRVGFPDADQNAMEVQHDDEDAMKYAAMRSIGTWSVSPSRALERAEERGGQAFRNSSRSWLVRVVLAQQGRLPNLSYRVLYSAPDALTTPNVDVLVDATTAADSPELRFAEATVRAESALGGPVVLVRANAFWRPIGVPNPGFGTDRPQGFGFAFVRSDLVSDTRVANLGYGFFGSGDITTGQVNVGTSGVREPPLDSRIDLPAAFAAIERDGGRALREQWSAEGLNDWTANAQSAVADGRTLVVITYFQPGQRGPGTTFRYDIATGRVERTP
jgi:hypothetical protein